MSSSAAVLAEGLDGCVGWVGGWGGDNTAHGDCIRHVPECGLCKGRVRERGRFITGTTASSVVALGIGVHEAQVAKRREEVDEQEMPRIELVPSNNAPTVAGWTVFRLQRADVQRSSCGKVCAEVWGLRV